MKGHRDFTMKYNGIISRKLESISQRIEKLRLLGPLSLDSLEKDYFLRSGIERTLQVCIEAMIDIAERIISLENLPPATTSTKALEQLESLGAIADARVYSDMVKFRNFIVHRYETIDTSILLAVCNNKLDDFDRFINEISN